ncbi:histidine phosphatase family protein [Plastorhodobacter daqingensis]|uniref:Histidine phosphatase family protein n=1 Tax=Plastorhodobacter daqingensis TaxID=1387281 RepID=A0ABW2UJT8_9RHOB
MTETRWHWIRHGPTHASAMIGWTDPPADLSDRGALERLAAALPARAVILSSHLRRAFVTADRLQGDRQRLPHFPTLHEIHFGAWEDQAHAEVGASYPQLLRAFREAPGTIAAPGGESWRDPQNRVNAAVDAVSLEHAGRDIIAVAHVGVILTQIERALGLTTPEAFAQRIEPLSLTRIIRSPKGWRAGPINHRP